MSGKTGKNRFMEVFDVLFIMVLCFATLLSTMLMRGKVLVGSGGGGGMTYTFWAWTFLLTFLGLGRTWLSSFPSQTGNWERSWSRCTGRKRRKHR